jgi:hypothetical protein
VEGLVIWLLACDPSLAFIKSFTCFLEDDIMAPDNFSEYFMLAVTCWAIAATFLLLHARLQREEARRAMEDASLWIRLHRCGTTWIGRDEPEAFKATWRRVRQW